MPILPDVPRKVLIPDNTFCKGQEFPNSLDRFVAACTASMTAP
jgi:hypothetical protein